MITKYIKYRYNSIKETIQDEDNREFAAYMVQIFATIICLVSLALMALGLTAWAYAGDTILYFVVALGIFILSSGILFVIDYRRFREENNDE